MSRRVSAAAINSTRVIGSGPQLELDSRSVSRQGSQKHGKKNDEKDSTSHREAGATRGGSKGSNESRPVVNVDEVVDAGSGNGKGDGKEQNCPGPDKQRRRSSAFANDIPEMMRKGRHEKTHFNTHCS